MEQTWILFSLAGIIALGTGDYIKKLILSKWGDKEVFLFMCFAFYVPLFTLNALLFWSGWFDVDLLRSGFIIGVLDFGIPLGMLTALKYLNVSFTLVFIRIISSFVILYIGIFLLWDQLSFYNLVWFFLWALAIFLLSGFRIGQKITLHPKWVIGLLMTTICIILSHSYLKYIVADVDIANLMFLKFSITFACIVLYMTIRKKFSNLNMQQARLVFPYVVITAVMFVLHFLYFLPGIYLVGPLSLGYKMLSYSLIVPILLSVIFLWEHVNKTRVFAFCLTIVSIFLFLI